MDTGNDLGRMLSEVKPGQLKSITLNAALLFVYISMF